MKSISQYGETILKISEFVGRLEESVQLEAFKFLLSKELGGVPDKTIPDLPKPVSVPKESNTRSLAPQELIRKCKPSSFTEKAVILAYWLEVHQQKPTFSSGDLKNAFEQAREQSPKNMSDLVSNLEATARIMKAEKVGAFQHYKLTGTAIDYVENCLSGQSE